MPHAAADLPNAELDILAWLWSGGPATARQIRDALAERRPMAHATVLTFLARLERKGFVTRRKEPGRRGYIYSPTRRPEATYRRLTGELLDRVFAGNPVRLVASLFDGRTPDKRQVEQLRTLLKELEEKSKH